MEGERRKQHSGKGEAQRLESDSKIQLLAPPAANLGIHHVTSLGLSLLVCELCIWPPLPEL